MQLDRFVSQGQPAWAELDALTGRAKGRVQALTAADVHRLGQLHRQAAADLAVARRRFTHDPVTARLEALVGRSRPLVYGTPVRPASARAFVTTGYWRRVPERPRLLAVAAALLWGSTLATGLWAHGNPTAAARVAGATSLSRQIVANGPQPGRSHNPGVTVDTAVASQIFTNNIKVALVAFAGGLTGGLITIASTLFNGVVTGVLLGWVIRSGGGPSFLRLILPHGLLELSLFTVASAAGLRAGWALVHPGHRTRAEALAVEGRAAVEMAVGTSACLVPCGLVEGYVTPMNLSLPWATVVGIALAVLFWALVAWRGRPERCPAVTRTATP